MLSVALPPPPHRARGGCADRSDTGDGWGNRISSAQTTGSGAVALKALMRSTIFLYSQTLKPSLPNGVFFHSFAIQSQLTESTVVL